MIESHKFPYLYEIRDDYAEALQKYLKTNTKRKKIMKFKKVRHKHVDFMKRLMSHQVKKNFTIA